MHSTALNQDETRALNCKQKSCLLWTGLTELTFSHVLISSATPNGKYDLEAELLKLILDCSKVKLTCNLWFDCLK